MYATATEAIEGLRHKRTGEVLPTKNVARNTKLIYFADELVGLKLHDTLIAMFHEDGVVLDTRENRRAGGRHGTGWFTNVTLDRLSNFTPARMARAGGLTYVLADPNAGWGSMRLYTHGCRISPDGSFENGLDPAIERHLARTIGNWNRRAKNYAKRVATAWSNWEQPLDCCEREARDPDGDNKLHAVGHLEANEPAIPTTIDSYVATLRQLSFHGEQLRSELARSLVKGYEELLPIALYAIEPDFPYPQATPRRR